MTNKEFMNMDFDNDKIKNSKDCRPFNKAMQHELRLERKEIPKKSDIQKLIRAERKHALVKRGEIVGYAGRGWYR